MSQNKRTRINQYTRVPEIFLIDENGDKIGITKTADAYKQAQDIGLDLVEVSPNSRPPVCKIIDYGKFQYEQSKMQVEQKKKNKQKDIKEMRLGVKIDDHDLQTKVKKVNQFLENGHNVKVSLRFKGREITQQGMGREVIQKFLSKLEIEYIVDKDILRQGRQLIMFIAPKNK